MKNNLKVNDLSTDLTGLNSRLFEKSAKNSKDKFIENIYCNTRESREKTEPNEKSVTAYMHSINKKMKSIDLKTKSHKYQSRELLKDERGGKGLVHTVEPKEVVQQKVVLVSSQTQITEED